MPTHTNNRKNSIVPQILNALEFVGPMSMAELADYLGKSKKKFGGVISRLSRQSGPDSPQRIHITRWVTDHPGDRFYPRAVYAFGMGRNAFKPVAKMGKERTRASFNKRSAMVASVFELGCTVRHRAYTLHKGRMEQMAALDRVATVRKIVG
jgi:hypothetical protein